MPITADSLLTFPCAMILYWCIQQRPINPNNWFDRFIGVINDVFAKKHQCRWLSKKRQMQGARLSSNEAYIRTSKQREQLQQRSSW
jgi:hypothetical protein